MKTMKPSILWICVLFTFVAGSLSSLTLNELEQEHQKLLDFKRDVYNQIQADIRQNPDSPDLPYLYFRLAQLSSEIEGIENPAKTANFYQKVLDLEPNFPDKDVVLYNLAYFAYEAAKQARDEKRERDIQLAMNWPDSHRLSEDQPFVKSAIDAYTEIYIKYLDSPYNSEALFRLGNIYYDLGFDARRSEKYYTVASKFFDILARREGDTYQNFGIFYRGWVKFTKGDYQDAIDDFSKILKTIEEGEASDEFKTYFESEAIENIAYSLIEADSTNFEQRSRAAAFARDSFNQLVNEEVGKRILDEAIDLKLQLNAPMQAVDIYKAYVNLYGMSLEAPSFIDSVMNIYKRYPNRLREEDIYQAVKKEQEFLVNNYQYGSDWYVANEGKPGFEDQLVVIRKAYKFLAPDYLIAFQNSNVEEDFRRYRALFEDYKKFPQFAQMDIDEGEGDWFFEFELSSAAGYLTLADQSQDPGKYLLAHEQLIEINSGFPNNDRYITNETNAFYCIEQVYDILNPSIDENPYTSPVDSTLITKPVLDSMYIDASVRYEQTLASEQYQATEKEDDLQKIIYRRAELRYENEDLDLAYEDYEKLLNLQITDELRKIAFSRLASINETRGDYTMAIDFYNQAANFAKTADERDAIKTNIAAAYQSDAEQLKGMGNFQQAAEKYIRLSDEIAYKDSAQWIAFRVKAIDMYNKIPQYDMSISLLKEIAKSQSRIDDLLGYYVRAWNIADSLMMNPQLGEQLRWEFVDMYPKSNQAYNIQLEIIKRYEDDPATKEAAAQMYLDLHAKAGDIDLGEDKIEDLMLNAIAIYRGMNNDAKLIELMLAFESTYAAHPAANEFLIEVAKMYKNMGDQDKYKDLALYINRKDPSIPLLESIASEELRDIFIDVNTLFEAKSYDSMRERINQYKDTENRYKQEGLDLRIETVYDQFDYIDKYIVWEDSYNEVIGELDDYLEKSSNELVLIGVPTKWKSKVVPRMKNLVKNTDALYNKVLDVIANGKEYDISDMQTTKALYLTAQMFEHSYQSLIDQLKKYLEVTTEAQEYRDAGPATYQQFAGAIASISNEYRSELQKRYLQTYLMIVTGFTEKTGYTDEYTDLAMERLIEEGVRKPKEYQQVVMDNSWNIDYKPVATITSANHAEKGLIEFCEIAPAASDVMLRSTLDAEIQPELLTIDYFCNQPVQIYVNDIMVDKQPNVVDTLVVDGMDIPHYALVTSQSVTQGRNTVGFSVTPGDSLSTTLFSAQYQAQYDKADLEFFRTTAEMEIVTDYSWHTIQATEIDPATTTPDSTWKLAGKGNFSFYRVQIQMMEDSNAIEIWSPEIDTSEVSTVYFMKTFDVDTEVLEGSMSLIAERVGSVWINGVNIFDSIEIMIDQQLSQVLPYQMPLDASYFVQGRNTVLIRVEGGAKYKGLLFDLDMFVKKP